MTVLSTGSRTGAQAGSETADLERRSLRRRRRRADTAAGYLFLAPQVVGLVVFMAGPLLKRLCGSGVVSFHITSNLVLNAPTSTGSSVNSSVSSE